MTPDTRPAMEIRSDMHAVAKVRGCPRVVRGIDRFTHMPDRTPAAMVWITDKHMVGRHFLELVALNKITICPGRTR